MEKQKRARWAAKVDRVAEIPMLVLAIVMIPLLLIPLVMTLSATLDYALYALNWFIWAAFAVELVVKTFLAPNRREYLVKHWYDVLIVVVPFLRPLRILAVATRLGFSWGRVFGRTGVVYTLAITIVAILAIAGAVTLLENDQGRSNTQIDGFATALWWAIVTVTTVGYGDITPVTLGGRALGVILMIGGIGIFGIFTASVAALFVEGNDDTDPALATIGEELRALRLQIAALEQRLADPDAPAEPRPCSRRSTPTLARRARMKPDPLSPPRCGGRCHEVTVGGLRNLAGPPSAAPQHLPPPCGGRVVQTLLSPQSPQAAEALRCDVSRGRFADNDIMAARLRRHRPGLGRPESTSATRSRTLARNSSSCSSRSHSSAVGGGGAGPTTSRA